MVTGSVAGMVYGEPRLTHDVDLVIALDEASIDALVREFPAAEFDCAPAEVIRVELHRRRRGHFNIIHHETGFKADVYLVGEDRLHAWAMAHRRHLQMGDSMLHVAPPEYVIVRKLEYYREGGSSKHLDDIRAMLRHCRDDLDMDELERRIASAGLGGEWALVR